MANRVQELREVELSTGRPASSGANPNTHGSKPAPLFFSQNTINTIYASGVPSPTGFGGVIVPELGDNDWEQELPETRVRSTSSPRAPSTRTPSIPIPSPYIPSPLLASAQEVHVVPEHTAPQGSQFKFEDFYRNRLQQNPIAPPSVVAADPDDKSVNGADNESGNESGNESDNCVGRMSF